MNRTDWLKYGIQEGYCSPPVCSTHDGLPTTMAEDQAFGDGGDPCIHVVRPYEDETVRREVEAYSSPAIWRKVGWMDADN